MREVELKLLLDEAGERAARRRLRELAPEGARLRSVRLTSVYLDTPDRALSRLGAAVRLRKEGRRWTQTVKHGRRMQSGLSSPVEDEAPAPGGRFSLDRVAEADARAALEAALAGRAPAPVFETRIRRTLLTLERDGAEIEIALDVGEIAAADRREPLRELELELKRGAPAALYRLTAEVAPPGALRFSRRSKAERGYAVAAGEAAVTDPPPVVKSGALALSPELTAEQAAATALRACLDQIAANAFAAQADDRPEGPHQLRVGLRRLRTAATLFREALGGPPLEALRAEARELAAVAGAARDLDVLLEERLRPLAAAIPDVAALEAALREAQGARRAVLQGRLREARTRDFVLELGAFVEGRGWLRPEDFQQSAALAQPAAEAAAAALDERWRRAAKLGERLGEIDDEGRHELRKRLKALRYAVEFFEALWPRKRVRRFLKRLKALQEDFGALQDAATARALLLDADAPGAGDPAAARAAGYLLGRAEAEALALRPALRRDWKALAAAGPFWR